MTNTSTENVFTDRLENTATIILPGEGERLTAGEGSCTFQVASALSGGQLGIYEIVVPPHTTGARLHYHRYMDEVFLVRKGRLTVQLGTEQRELPEGAVVYVPRFTPHAFSNGSDEPLVLTLIFNPAEKREGYFKGLFTLLNEPELDVQRFLQLSHKYDSQPVDEGQLRTSW
ncbi:MAG: cupin domain-containing protein [Chitinophagaceae bacterium]|nr:MAG: cupin domain-containing protein [Chitinophagaceae bacterium]